MRLPITTLLFHYGLFEPLWQQPSLLQVGPQIPNGANSIRLTRPSVSSLLEALSHRSWDGRGILMQYSDPFMMRFSPLRGLNNWPGPRVLACGDLHHGRTPIETLEDYLKNEPHDALLLTFNPSLVNCLRERLNIPVRCLAPTFFRYPMADNVHSRRMELLHVGNIGSNHPKRRELVETLIARKQIPFRHTVTNNAEEAAILCSKYALILNVPLNNDLNHRFFEVMAAGVPQVIYGQPTLMGELHQLSNRPDVFWANSIPKLEALVHHLFANPLDLLDIPVAKPPYWTLENLLKKALAP